MGLRIRAATIKDGSALARLRWDFSDEPRRELEVFLDEFAAFWAGALRDGRWTVWVAEVEGRIVSNIWIYRVPKVPRPYEHADAYGYVTNVYTVPDMRNADIGAELIARVIEWARAEELEAVYVSPSVESVRFYERAGFTWSKDWMEIVL